MGFVSFIKKLFGTKEIATEIDTKIEEIKPIILNPTSELIVPLEETLKIEESSTINTQITDSVTVTNDIDKKRNYKPRKKVTKKPANKKRVTK